MTPDNTTTTSWTDRAADLPPVEPKPTEYEDGPPTGTLMRAKMFSLCLGCNGTVRQDDPIVLVGKPQGYHPACADEAGVEVERSTIRPEGAPEF